MLIFLVIFINLIATFCDNYKIDKIACVASLVLLILHYPLGRDIPTYIEILQTQPVVPTFGVGRFFFIDWWYSVFNWISGNPDLFFFIINGITTSLLFYTICRYSEKRSLSFFLLLTSGLFAVYMQSAIRQGLAMAVLVFATYQFLLKDKYLSFLICVSMVATFHDVAIVGLFFIPIRYFLNRINLKIVLIGLLSSVAFGLFISKGLIFIAPYIGYFGKYMSSYDISWSGIGLQLVQFAIILIGQFNSRDLTDEMRFGLIVNITSLMIYFLMLGFPLVSRVCDYLQVINLLFIPMLLVNMDRNVIKKLFIVSIIVVNFVLYQNDLNNSLYSHHEETTIFECPYYSFITNNYHDVIEIQD